MKGFRYEQRTGHLALVNGDYHCPYAFGFAGREDGRNNPAFEHEVGTGPIPRGVYFLRELAHKRFAPPAFRLEAADQETEERLARYGRSGFWLHGGTISHGCPIFQHTVRVAIRSLLNSGFDHLEVVP